MKVLVADKFEQSGLDGLATAACAVACAPELRGDRLAESIPATRTDVRIGRRDKETGKVPNAVNLARRSPATHRLIVRHRDRPGVLAHVIRHLGAAHLKVRETENVVYDGAAVVGALSLLAIPEFSTEPPRPGSLPASCFARGNP